MDSCSPPSRPAPPALLRRGLSVGVMAMLLGCAGDVSADPAAREKAKDAAAVPQVIVPAEGAPTPVNVEKVYYKQFQLVRAATNALADQRPGIPDLYFIGFAGDAGQDVFLREIRSVRALFDRRFDTEGRSLLLINNRATVDTVPLANSHNLLAALGQVSARMDPEEDVLFLFLTTHGKPGVLAVDFDPLALNDLTAANLRGLLDRTRIKWRVIIVSACYSGSFIDALKDDHTLVVTAARKDRVSFGCSHENDFTYFGRAYFDKALRGNFSFVGAFDEAKTTVHKWETDEELKPSLPQISIGKEIGPKLAEVEERLRRLNPAN